MKHIVCVLLSTAVAACASADAPTPPDPSGLPETCAADDDCLIGVECENAWCLDDGTCRRGTPTGLPCGDGGMCVDSTCIER